jgi:signal transduction histidine kinase
LILASVLWTAGLLFLLHMTALHVVHAVPQFRGRPAAISNVIAVLAMAGGLFAARQSLTPFRRLRHSLRSLRAGEGPRVPGEYPHEVQPLVNELNALLEDREKAVKRALATAGDLAHGLKTPLALLAQDAERAAAAGNLELAESISQQVERMSRQVSFQLARARAAASGSTGAARCLVAPCAEALARTLRKLHAGRSLEIRANVPPELFARVQREDLEEILGNLLDNACKWASARVTLNATQTSGALLLTVDDDGPGLPQELRAKVLERGVRADEAAPGSGLGLAIVRDLAELYGGTIALEGSPLGGLRATVTLPASW